MHSAILKNTITITNTITFPQTCQCTLTVSGWRKTSVLSFSFYNKSMPLIVLVWKTGSFGCGFSCQDLVADKVLIVTVYLIQAEYSQ